MFHKLCKRIKWINSPKTIWSISRKILILKTKRDILQWLFLWWYERTQYSLDEMKLDVLRPSATQHWAAAMSIYHNISSWSSYFPRNWSVISCYNVGYGIYTLWNTTFEIRIDVELSFTINYNIQDTSWILLTHDTAIATN